MGLTGKNQPGRRETGFSLLEVLISGAIVSSGLAGFALALFASVSGTAESSYRSIASQLADSAVSMIEVSPSNQQVFFDPVPETEYVCDSSNFCSAQRFAQSSFKEWNEQLARRLPSGIGIICRDSSPIYDTVEKSDCAGTGLPVIKISWASRAGQSVRESIVIRVAGK